MYHDSEPLRQGVVVPCTTWDIAYAIRWYYDNQTMEHAAKYLNTDTETAHRFSTLAWIERMLTRGYDMPEKELSSYNRMKATFLEYTANKQQEKADKPKVDIHAVIMAKAMEFLGDIEAKKDTKEDVNWYEFLNTLGVKPTHVNYIMNEIFGALKPLSEEADYSWEPIMADLIRIKKNKAAVAKVGKRKVIKADKVIKGLKFLKNSDEFKIESINPERIVGASVVWVFNVKIRQLACYQVHEGGSLTVKGTTLHNFDPEKSAVRTLRKPEEILPKILDSTRKQCEKLFIGLSTKPLKASGRVNKDCVILRVES